MKWKNRLSDWHGRTVEIRIEDKAGQDPIAEPRTCLLHRIEVTPDDRYVQFYISDHQFMAVPVFDQEHTVLESDVFESHDTQAKLVYHIRIV
ncbi:hypothetical protein [Paenibacillus hamazuiensis]|uniref:hypothetical protein n=1 Tax=Paenibacillus hamazuiensis TaxID=2936508 RepID=UPI0020106B08|nr:hypothetical protein [Paenibacillus hamazuiensis]